MEKTLRVSSIRQLADSWYPFGLTTPRKDPRERRKGTKVHAKGIPTGRRSFF
jgi:hypothetical protein